MGTEFLRTDQIMFRGKTMVRQYKPSTEAANNAGENELRAAAADNAPKAKKVWDCYLNTDKGYGDSVKESELVAAFEIKAGKSKKDQTSYFMLTGFSKELGGVNIGLTKQVDKIIERLVDAGFENQICAVLEAKGILK